MEAVSNSECGEDSGRNAAAVMDALVPALRRMQRMGQRIISGGVDSQMAGFSVEAWMGFLFRACAEAKYDLDERRCGHTRDEQCGAEWRVLCRRISCWADFSRSGRTFRFGVRTWLVFDVLEAEGSRWAVGTATTTNAITRIAGRDWAAYVRPFAADSNAAGVIRAESAEAREGDPAVDHFDVCDYDVPTSSGGGGQRAAWDVFDASEYSESFGDGRWRDFVSFRRAVSMEPGRRIRCLRSLCEGHQEPAPECRRKLRKKVKRRLNFNQGYALTGWWRRRSWICSGIRCRECAPFAEAG